MFLAWFGTNKTGVASTLLCSCGGLESRLAATLLGGGCWWQQLLGGVLNAAAKSTADLAGIVRQIVAWDDLCIAGDISWLDDLRLYCCNFSDVWLQGTPWVLGSSSHRLAQISIWTLCLTLNASSTNATNQRFVWFSIAIHWCLLLLWLNLLFRMWIRNDLWLINWCCLGHVCHPWCWLAELSLVWNPWLELTRSWRLWM